MPQTQPQTNDELQNQHMYLFLVGEVIEDAKKNLPDGKEMTFNKVNGGRTFPSLVVTARPNLRSKNISSQTAQKERSDLGDLTFLGDNCMNFGQKMTEFRKESLSLNIIYKYL